MAGRMLLSRRFLHGLRVVYKDEKLKQMLKKLGIQLQKGQINHDEDQGHAREIEEPSSRLKPVATIRQPPLHHQNILSYYYDIISHMSEDDLIIQQNCDQGRQLFSVPSDHFLDRKSIIANLPDEINLQDSKQMEQVDEIYKKLSELDNDKLVHLKYYKRYLNDYDDPVQTLIQGFNGIDKKFKLLRRMEIDSLSLAPGAYLYLENLFNLPYNVVGFDRLFLGLPLRKEPIEKCLPQEFVEDLPWFSTKVSLHKRDLDFIDPEHSVLVDPKKITKHYRNKMDGYRKHVDMPPNLIVIPDITRYHQLPQNPDISVRIENEILLMRKMLVNEISGVLKAGSPLTRHVEFLFKDLKTNQWKLCESRLRNTDSMYEYRNVEKEFNLVPNFANIMRSVKHRRQLKAHLVKLFLINVEDQVDILTRIKYLDDKAIEKFLQKLVQNINNVIKYKLMHHFKPIKIPCDIDALMFEPYQNSNPHFKRLHWLNRWKLDREFRPVRRVGVRCNWGNFDNYVE